MQRTAVTSKTAATHAPSGPSRGAVFVRLLLWVAAAGAALAVVGVGGTFLADALPVASPVDDSASMTAALESAEFRLPSLDGGRLGPPDFRGKVVVADLWATWCGPCRLQAKYFDELLQEYGDDVAFLAINTGEDEGKVRAFAAKSPFPYPVLLDPEQTLFARFGVSSLPTVMVIDPEGRIVFLESRVVDARTLREQIAAAGARS